MSRLALTVSLALAGVCLSNAAPSEKTLMCASRTVGQIGPDAVSSCTKSRFNPLSPTGPVCLTIRNHHGAIFKGCMKDLVDIGFDAGSHHIKTSCGAADLPPPDLGPDNDFSLCVCHTNDCNAETSLYTD